MNSESSSRLNRAGLTFRSFPREREREGERERERERKKQKALVKGDWKSKRQNVKVRG